MLDLHLPERKKAGAIQERVSHIYNQQIIPALSDLCDELSPEQGRMIVDKLEIDIGVITDLDLEQDLPYRLLTRFREEVKKLKLTSTFNLDISAQESAMQSDTDDQKARSRVDLLIHFFRHGSVPWWNPYSNRDLHRWISEQFAEDEQLLFSAVGAELKTRAFRKRVVGTFSDRQFQLLFRYFGLENVYQLYLALKNEIYQKNRNQPESISWQKLRIPLLETLLEQLWTYRSSTTYRLDTHESPIQMVTTRQKKFAIVNTIHFLEKTHGLPQKIVGRAISRIPQAEALFSPTEWKILHDQTDTNIGIDKENAMERPDFIGADSDQSNKAYQGSFIEIQNAGLVLLWTNLDRLFTALGYVKEKTFVDHLAIHRAVHLLHYISFGHNLGAEHEWTLNKLLCGLPPDSFVPYDIELTDKEKEEGEAMVKATIKNWSALKNTSIEGFRDTFLFRNGIITPDLNGWRLQVEHLSYDIMLKKLPWPISVVKLPWNNHFIHVQW